MRSSSAHLALAALGGAFIGVTAHAQHIGDIFIADENDQITTGLIEEDSSISPGFIFAADFGDSGFPGFTANPGYDTLPGMFTVGTRIGFNVLDGLKVWNGDGFDLTDGESLSISFLSAEVTVHESPVDGFDLAVQSNGGYHRHYSYFLNAEPGQADPDPGVYLLNVELYSTDPSLDNSEPFWLVFNHEVSSEVHLEAIAWAEANLVPGTPCLADLAVDGDVGPADLAQLLSSWGSCDQCAADLNGDGDVNAADLALLLDSWGPCAP